MNYSPFGESFDSGDAYLARMEARRALEQAVAPSLFGTATINLGTQGTASIKRIGTRDRGTMIVCINGKETSRVDFHKFHILIKTADDAFAEAKRRITYYIHA